MKRSLLYLAVLIIAAGCGNSGNGELTGVPDRPTFYQPDPYGMTFIPLGSFTMGTGDQDVPYSQVQQPKTVSVSSFYMDETEITNNEYRQFVYWVRDSLAHTFLGYAQVANPGQSPEHFIIDKKLNDRTQQGPDDPTNFNIDSTGAPVQPEQYIINWKEKIDWKGEKLAQGTPNPVERLFLPVEERFFHRKEIDSRKLYYRYFWIDLQKAAKASNRWQHQKNAQGQMTGGGGNYSPAIAAQGNRRAFVMEEVINVYPDTLAWIADFSYSYNEPMTKTYFWHPAYDNYPVVGVTWAQAQAFCVWRTQYMNTYLQSQKGEPLVSDFRLPTETEWEYAARGGYEENPYPWGGPYPRNQKGCFLANFKPQRGNYAADGGIQTVIAGHYPPNDFGLYDMSGNVAEWTQSAYDEVSFNVTWDLNPSYTYNAKESDPSVLKRKVIRGGSWKDVSYFLHNGTRSYEYQDSAKSYIGFRCVQSYLGRAKDDNPSKSSEVYK